MILRAAPFTRGRLVSGGLGINVTKRFYAQGANATRLGSFGKRVSWAGQALGAILVGYVCQDVYNKYTSRRDFEQCIAEGRLDEYITQGHLDDHIMSRQFADGTRPLGSTAPLDSVRPPQHNTSDEVINAVRQELEALLGNDAIDDSPSTLKARSSTPWSKSPTDRTASLVVYPQTTEHVSEIMKICHSRRVPVTGYSGGTSLDGALAATRGGICVDFSRMNKVLAIHERDLDVVVQPAVGWQVLDELLSPLDLFFPPDPGPGAQIGGMIGTGCSGTNAYRYGTMKDWVIGMTVVLADGTIVKTKHRPRKSTAGYDLGRLMVGSAGTLGLVTEATLKVTAKPTNEHVAVVAFPSMQKAVNTVIELVQKGMQVAAVEFLDEVFMHAVNQASDSDRRWREVPTLFMKFSGSAASVKEQIGTVQKLAKQNGSQSFDASGDPEQVEALWSGRKNALWSFINTKPRPDDIFLGSDVAVPISRLGDIVEETKERLKGTGLKHCGFIGHVGDGGFPNDDFGGSLTVQGNFHFSILHGPEETSIAREFMESVHKRGVDMEGTVTGEHGVGLAMRELLRYEVGDEAVDMMRKVTQIHLHLSEVAISDWE